MSILSNHWLTIIWCIELVESKEVVVKLNIIVPYLKLPVFERVNS
jgi:hypothetical protein